MSYTPLEQCLPTCLSTTFMKEKLCHLSFLLQKVSVKCVEFITRHTGICVIYVLLLQE